MEVCLCMGDCVCACACVMELVCQDLRGQRSGHAKCEQEVG